MRHALEPRPSAALTAFARGRGLLAFDFDGTLAPIVEDRESAGMRERTRGLLAELSALYPTAIVSGRSRADVAARVRGTGVHHVIGNHGNEPAPNLGDLARSIAAARTALEPRLRGLDGIALEDKRYSLSIHYRQAGDPRVARAAIQRALAGLPTPMRVMGGKRVVNLIPQNARHKGDVVIELRERVTAEWALFVGDDVTDEDVFTMPAQHRSRLVGIRIGKSERTAATLFLHSQYEIDALLALLVALRSGR